MKQFVRYYCSANGSQAYCSSHAIPEIHADLAIVNGVRATRQTWAPTQ